MRPRRTSGLSTAERRRRTSRAWLLVAAVALLVNGITVTTLLTGDRGTTVQSVGVDGVYDDARASTAIELATVQALGMVSLDATSSDPEVAELADRTTATFRLDFDEMVESFLDQVRTDGLEVDAEVTAAGISDLGAERATVVVATSGEATRGEEPARPHDFQVRVTLAWIDDDWRVDDLEFV